MFQCHGDDVEEDDTGNDQIKILVDNNIVDLESYGSVG